MPALTGSKNRDADSGRYVRCFGTQEFIEAVRELGPAVGTQDIADKIGCDRDTAYERLMELVDVGEIETRKVGRSRIWSVSESNE